MNLQEAFDKLDGVGDEFSAATFSLGHTLRTFESDPGLSQAGAPEKLTLHHVQVCGANLEITYLVRLFAEFEGILRDYWAHGRKRPTAPPMVDLMNSIAAYCFMNDDDRDDAHQVREYRNGVVHEHRQNPQFGFQTCRSRLARFVRWLPRTW